MKKNIVLAILLVIATATFSQQTKSSSVLTKQFYLKKSKNQNMAAWLFLGGGSSLILTSIAAVYPKDYAPDYGYPINTHKQIHQANLALALFLTGLSSMFVSIPLFIASKRNKWEARTAKAFLKMEPTAIFQGYNKGYISYPSLSVKISLH